MNELLTIKELAEKLKMSVTTLYRFKREGMPYIIEKPLRFDFIEVFEWFKTRERGGANRGVPLAITDKDKRQAYLKANNSRID